MTAIPGCATGRKMVEYDCEGCGVHVHAFGIDKPPAHGFCATCGWLNEYLPPEEIMDALRRCELIRYAALQEIDRVRRDLLRLLRGLVGVSRVAT